MRLLLLIIFLCFFTTGFSEILHVKSEYSAEGLNNGTSWKHAFYNLQVAIDSSKAGDTIKVEAGVYYITQFYKDSITLLGGYSFLKGDTTDAKRNWAANHTILSGRREGIYTDYLMTVNDFIGMTLMDGFLFNSSTYAGIRIENTKNFIVRNSVFEDHRNTALQITNSIVSFINCVFTNNGSAVLNSLNSKLTITNSLFTYNGLYNVRVISNINSDLSLINCTLVGNRQTVFYGNGTGTANIRNCIFAGNLSINNYTEDTDIETNGHNLLISNCITQTFTNASTGRLLTAFNPRFVNIANPAGPDNRYFTSDDGLQLSVPCSPALNSGSNSFLDTITTDILGQSRVYNNGTVDMGAYERQAIPETTFKTVYVKSNVNTGANDGSSWQNAFPTLQEALLYCADTIKIAEGIYQTSNSNSDSIFYIENKKVLLGGYPSFGNPSDNERNPFLYLSILQGKFPGLNQTTRSPVIKMYYTDSTTIIDGISFNNGENDPTRGTNPDALLINYRSNPTIQNCNFVIAPSKGITRTGVTVRGESSPSFFNNRFSAYNSYRGGTALSCYESTLTIRNCTFLGDTAGIRTTINQTPVISISLTNSQLIMDSTQFWKIPYSGSGNFIVSNNSLLDINTCIFRDVQTNSDILIKNTSKTTGVISNCIFKNYNVFSSKALIYNDNSSIIFNRCLFDSSGLMIENINRSAPTFNNCVSINGQFMKNTKSFPAINNSTIVNTFISSIAGSQQRSEKELITSNDSTTVRANNTIFWTFKQTLGKQEILNETLQGTSEAILTNCITRTYGTNGINGNIVGENPRFVQLTDPDGPDNIMFTADDGIRLANCSPAINSGTSDAGTILSRDILNQPRIFGNSIDIGAYEFQGQVNLNNSFFVNATATGDNTGVNWINSYNTLQAAVCNVCADTIRVAAGTYYPATTTRDSSFYIDRPITMLGGYPSFGNPAEDLRDANLNTTIIDGNIGSQNDSTDNSRTLLVIVGTKDSVVIDGFTFKNGFNSNGGIFLGTGSSAGIYTYNNHTIIRNCNFLNNTGRLGGAIAVEAYTTCKITGSLFFNNNASNYGGAIHFSGDSLIVSNAVFEKNNSFGEGGAIKLTSGIFNISNSVLYQNFTIGTNLLGAGGAVWAASNLSFGSINNCTFRENKTQNTLAYGGGLYTNQILKTVVKNCIFSGNSTGSPGQGSYPDMDWNGNYNTVSQTILQKPRLYTSPLKILYASEIFIDSLNPKGIDQKWMTADDGLIPNYNSAAINFGNNTPVENLPWDLAFAQRIINDTVDAGAYEYQNMPVANAGRDTSICIGTFAQIGKPGNPKHTYKWSSDPIGFTSSEITPKVNPSVATTYFLEVSNGIQTTKDTIIVTPQSTLTSSVAITASATSICQGSNIVFTAANVHGGDTPSYQWQINNLNTGTNQSTFSSNTLNNGDSVRVIMTSSSTCSSPVATSNTIKINVTPLITPAISIKIEPSPICTGDTLTIVATPVNSGSNPFYTLIIGGVVYQSGTSTTFRVPTSHFTSGSQFWVRMISNERCVSDPTAYSNLITVNTNTSVTPSIQISGNTTILAGQSSLISATSVNGGIQPSYQWQESYSTGNWQNIANATAPTINYAPISTGYKLRCILTSNEFCARPQSVISNTLLFTVNTATGLNNNLRNVFVKLYPNPATNFIIIDSLNLADKWETCIITGINSRQYLKTISVRNATKITIATEQLISGLYFITLQNKEGKKIHLKFVKL